jgi:light-regulated signal transduction histidine kinase (bacteriophytochrome)
VTSRRGEALPPETVCYSGNGKYTTAMLNILEDFAGEKARLEQAQRAMVNILEDFTEERKLLEETPRAVINILEDAATEKKRLEEAQRAMLNLLEDFDIERERTRAANKELRAALEDLRRAKEAADAANRELEAFSYSVSHDLRAPLRAIDGFSLALMEDYHDLLDEDGRDSLQRVRNATKKMGLLIDDLLKLSRLTRGEMTIAPVDLTSIAKTVAAELQGMQPERRVVIRIAEGLLSRGDPNLVKVAMQNLMGNAWKFTAKRQDAVIEVGSRAVEGTTAFYVRDNGAGFDMAYANKLFDTFQRLHSEKEYPGTGIGLSIVQRVVHRHGGSVWAEGAPDKGATFWFTLEGPVKIKKA